MYVTVMDFSTSSVTTLAWDVETATDEEAEVLLERMGYHLSQVSYMLTEDEPDYGGVVEVSDVLPTPKPVGKILGDYVDGNPPDFD